MNTTSLVPPSISNSFPNEYSNVDIIYPNLSRVLLATTYKVATFHWPQLLHFIRQCWSIPFKFPCKCLTSKKLEFFCAASIYIFLHLMTKQYTEAILFSLAFKEVHKNYANYKFFQFCI